MRALFLSLAVLLSLPMLAVRVQIGGINYDLVAETKQATVIAKSSGKYSGKIVIPESVEHGGTAYSVTSILGRAFEGCSGLTSVTIPNSVTSIGYGAFQYCSGLTSLTIPNSVTSIGERAFYECSGLTSVTIGSGVTSIGSSAFWVCPGLTSVHISDIAAWCNINFESYYSNPLSYAYHLYMNGEEVKDLVIPNSVTSIGNYAFYECSGLTSVTIPNSVTSIGYEAFYECSGLTSVTIPNSVMSIEGSAFDGCSGLTSVTIPNSVTSIGDYVFYGCSGLTLVTIPNSVTSIGEYAFSRCSGLTSVTIPNSVTSIERHAFDGCSGLTSVTIPNSVTSIGYYAFYGCSGLTSVTISDIAAWCNIDFESNYSNPLRYAHHLYLNGEEVKDLVIPNSVTSIGEYTFQGCSGLTSVTIHNSVTSIENYAFNGCSGLTSVTIPNSVTSIGSYAFSSCSGLTSVTIGSGVTSIGSKAFAYCSELLDVYCYAENVPSTKSDAFEAPYPEYVTLHVPDASIESYKAKALWAPWNRFRKIVALTDEETGIDELKGENGNVKTEIYDLSGRRVQKAQKGIFIQNGKVVVK